MSNFLDDNLNQSVFFDINYLEVLGSNIFEYCLYYLLENDDIVSDFYARYKNKNVGRKAYPPHFHAKYSGHDALFNLNGDILESELPKRAVK
jgi:hypothetical protein